MSWTSPIRSGFVFGVKSFELYTREAVQSYNLGSINHYGDGAAGQPKLGLVLLHAVLDKGSR